MGPVVRFEPAMRNGARNKVIFATAAFKESKAVYLRIMEGVQTARKSKWLIDVDADTFKARRAKATAQKRNGDVIGLATKAEADARKKKNGWERFMTIEDFIDAVRQVRWEGTLIGVSGR